MNQLEAIYREALENIKNTLDGCGMRQDEEMPLSELLLLRVAREALSAQGGQGTDQVPTKNPITCPHCGSHNNHDEKTCYKQYGDKCPFCEMNLDGCMDCRNAFEVVPPTETQERCPKCKTEVEWVVPPIPGVKPFFQCQDGDCNWISDDDFPVTESKMKGVD